jgi:hypothetical protein
VTRLALSRDPLFRWCVRRECGSGQLHVPWPDNLDADRMRCASCLLPQCATHAVPWHWGETCAHYDARIRSRRAALEIEEALSARVLQKISKLCPNKQCGYRLQKIGGCDHVRCKCKQSWRKARADGIGQALVASMTSAGFVCSRTLGIRVVRARLKTRPIPRGWSERPTPDPLEEETWKEDILDGFSEDHRADMAPRSNGNGRCL